jgi:spore germination protein KA
MSTPFSFFKRKRHISANATQNSHPAINISTNLQDTILQLQKILGDSKDVKIIHFLETTVPFVLCYIEGLVNKQQLDLSIIEPIKRWQNKNQKDSKSVELIHQIEVSSQINPCQHVDEVITAILRGQVGIFVDGLNQAYTIPLDTWPTRAVEEPVAQTIVRGSREGFTETLQVNTSLLRRRLLDSSLRFKAFHVGNITKTPILVSYLESQVDQKVLQEVIKRVSNINTNNIFESGMLEELIGENGYTPFPTFHASERPDTTASAIAEGKVVIMLEGTPFVLITPTTFISFFQAAEDYYHHFDISSFTRIIRIFAFFLSLSLSAIFIAVQPIIMN